MPRASGRGPGLRAGPPVRGGAGRVSPGAGGGEPGGWKVVEHVREKVSCRCCEAISQPPAPSHPIARGRAGPNLLALVLAAKYGQPLPLTRQSMIYAGEGVELDV